MRKYILIALVLIVSVKAFAQFPVKQTTTKEEILRNEGFAKYQQSSGYTATATSRTKGEQYYTTGGSPYTVVPGMFGLASIEVSASAPCEVIFTVSPTSAVGGATDNGGSSYFRVRLDSGMLYYKMPYRMIYETGSIGFSVITVKAGTNVEADIRWSVDAIEHTADFVFDAGLLFGSSGDSRVFSAGGLVSGTGTVLNPGRTIYSSRVIDSLRKDGLDIRKYVVGISGITAAKYLTLLQSGALDQQIKKAAFWEIALGYNDSALGNATTTGYQATLQSMIDYFYARNPKLAIILTQPYGSTASPQSTNIASYRTVMVSLRASYAAAGKDIVTWNQASFIPDPTAGVASANFTETTDPKVHARFDTGHALLAPGFLAAIRSTTKYFQLTGHN